MTQLKDNMSNIEKIRQEIERRKDELERDKYINIDAKTCRQSELKYLERFIDSLPACKDSLQVQEICKENPDSLTSLEEAAEEYAYKGIPEELKSGVKPIAEQIIENFIAGAKWQANQLLKGSPLPEDTVLFQKGVEEGKRLMMEEAVEGEIGYWNQRGLSIRLDKSLERLGYDMDTKVRIIIIKDND